MDQVRLWGCQGSDPIGSAFPQKFKRGRASSRNPEAHGRPEPHPGDPPIRHRVSLGRKHRMPKLPTVKGQIRQEELTLPEDLENNKQTRQENLLQNRRGNLHSHPEIRLIRGAGPRSLWLLLTLHEIAKEVREFLRVEGWDRWVKVREEGVRMSVQVHAVAVLMQQYQLQKLHQGADR